MVNITSGINWEAMSSASHSYTLTDKERRRIALLVVEPEMNLRKSMRQALVTLGFEDITDAPDHPTALERLEEKRFTHIIFDSKNGLMPARNFLSTLLQRYPHIIALPSSSNPTVDDVFDLLITGARGYIVKPFTAGSLDDSLVYATKGEPISESIRNTKHRNEALASLILHSLDRLALVMRQSRKFETAQREIPRRLDILRRSIDVARTFVRGGDPKLRQAIFDLAIERSQNTRAEVNVVRKRIRRRPNDAT